VFGGAARLPITPFIGLVNRSYPLAKLTHLVPPFRGGVKTPPLSTGLRLVAPNVSFFQCSPGTNPSVALQQSLKQDDQRSRWLGELPVGRKDHD
jgi:hypothetical protein